MLRMKPKQCEMSYVSVEHLMLAMIKKPTNPLRIFLRSLVLQGIDFLQCLSKVRGNQTVNTDNPEATYDTLEKYGYDLVERAEKTSLIL